MAKVVVSNREEKASQEHLMERLEMAQTELEFALERSSKMPITDVSLLRRRMMLKCAFKECTIVLHKHKLHLFGAEEGVQRTRVCYFEFFSEEAYRFVRDVEIGSHLARHRSLNPTSYDEESIQISESTINTLLSFSGMNDQATDLKTLEGILGDANAKPTSLSYSFLKFITRNFSEEIGRGGFGVVYMGHLGSRRVAVKKFSIQQGFSDKLFVDEINCLIKTKHGNIVRFLGYCSESYGVLVASDRSHVMAEVQQRLLCFEYVPNGNLQKYLKDNSHKDEWQIRYRMIRGICHGLNYLHGQRIIHLDLKSENILLDARLEPKITDFGVSKCFDEGITIVYTENLCGTMGTIAPETIHNREITYKSDIYGLGFIIIKILAGCNNYDFDKWHTSIDVDGPQVKSCIEIAQKCVAFDQHERPTIGEIMQKLNEIERL